MTDSHSDSFALPPPLRKKYFALRLNAGNVADRDTAFKKMHDLIVHEVDYEFNSFTFMTDRKIQKGGILQALRDACKE